MDTDAAITYGPKPARRWLICIVLLVLGAVLLAGIGPRLLRPGRGMPDDTAGVAAGVACLLAGLAILVTIVRRVPRLTIDQNGITVHSLFSRKYAPWQRLGPFSLATAFGGRRTLRQAIAPLAGQGAASRTFTIPDGFETNLEVIVAEIAARRGSVFANPFATAPTGPLSYGVAGFRWPWLTFVLLAVFIGVFALEQRLAVAPAPKELTPALGTLVALGGVSRNLVLSGQWWRMLTAPFLHANVAHVTANGIAFVLAGYTLERLVGRAWMFCIFALGALAGSVASIAIQPPNTVSVGASGAIMAMLVALFMISFRLPSGRMKTATQVRTARMAIPALIPLSHGTGGLHIDYGAHLGGALLGAGLGLLVLRAWQGLSPLPRFQAGARVVAVVAVLGFAGSAGAVALRYPSYASVTLIPPALFPRTEAQLDARWARLLAEYPRDPRAHMLAGNAKADQGDAAGAEAEFRAALGLAEANASLFSPSMPNRIRGVLALTVAAEGRKPEAMAMVRDACAVEGDAAPGPDVLATLVRNGLCGTGADTEQP